MVTERDRIWNATLRVAAGPTADVTSDAVLAELDAPLGRGAVRETLNAMWELGVLRCADGGGRQEGTYRLNNGIFE